MFDENAIKIKITSPIDYFRVPESNEALQPTWPARLPLPELLKSINMIICSVDGRGGKAVTRPTSGIKIEIYKLTRAQACMTLFVDQAAGCSAVGHNVRE